MKTPTDESVEARGESEEATHPNTPNTPDPEEEEEEEEKEEEEYVEEQWFRVSRPYLVGCDDFVVEEQQRCGYQACARCIRRAMLTGILDLANMAERPGSGELGKSLLAKRMEFNMMRGAQGRGAAAARTMATTVTAVAATTTTNGSPLDQHHGVSPKTGEEHDGKDTVAIDPRLLNMME